MLVQRNVRTILFACILLIGARSFSNAQAPAQALQSPLSEPVDARLESALRGEHVQLASFRYRVNVAFYEDRAHTGDNEALKGELGRFIADNHLEGRLAMLALANASDYNYAPASSLVRTGVRAVAERIGIDILLDFDGTMLRAPIRCQNAASNVLVIDRAGRILFRHSGIVGSSERTQLYRTVRRALAASRE